MWEFKGISILSQLGDKITRKTGSFKVYGLYVESPAYLFMKEEEENMLRGNEWTLHRKEQLWKILEDLRVSWDFTLQILYQENSQRVITMICLTKAVNVFAWLFLLLSISSSTPISSWSDLNRKYLCQKQ